jgi:hypothetical protein
MKTSYVSRLELCRRTAVCGIGALLLLFGQASFGVVLTNEYWIDDNQYGSNLGTLADPYIASNYVSFDSIMNQLTAKSNVIIHLLPGKFQTASHSWHVKESSRLIGSGMGATTIQVTSNAAFGATAIVGAAGANYVEISDLTVDVNGNASATNNHADGIVLQGRHGSVRRVRVMNQVGVTNESFGIFITPLLGGNLDHEATGNIIENCIVDSIQGSYASAIAPNGGEAMVLNCRVYLPNSASALSMGYNPAGARRSKFIGNYSEGGTRGFYTDTGTITNLILANNTFKNCLMGIVFNHDPYEVDSVLIANNIIELNTNNVAGRYGIVSYFSARNITVSGNFIRMLDDLPPPAADTRAIGYGAVTNSIIHGNIWDARLGTSFTDCDNIIAYDNHDLQGNAITNANQVAPPNGTYRRTISSGSSANLSLADKYVGVKIGSALSVVLPTAASRPGKEIIVSAEHATPNITITTVASQLINNSGSAQNITSGYTSRRFISDGTNWFTY